MLQEAAEQLVGKQLQNWTWEDWQAFAELLTVADLDDEFTFDCGQRIRSWCTAEVAEEWEKRFEHILRHEVGYLRFTRFSHGMQPALEIFNPTKAQRDFIHAVMRNQFIDSLHYKVTHKAGAFLQCDDDKYILIEFWLPTYQEFITYIKSNLPKE